MIEYAIPAGVFAAVLALLLAIRQLILKRLYARAPAGTSAREVIDVLRVPSLLWILAAALTAALANTQLSGKITERVNFWVLAFVTVSFSIVISAALIRTLDNYGRQRNMAFATSGLAKTLVRVFVFGLGASILLGLLGQSFTPVLATIGGVGFVVAFALKDTLENLFAGILILVEEPIAVGHYIKLGDNEEGMVTDIGWRTTRIRNAKNSMIVIPNAKLTSAVLTNYMIPERRMTIDLHVHISQDADARRAMDLSLDIVRAAPGVLPDPEPQAFFNPGVLATHIQFSVWFSVAGFPDQGPIQSSIRLELLERFRAESIPLPRIEIR